MPIPILLPIAALGVVALAAMNSSKGPATSSSPPRPAGTVGPASVAQLLAELVNQAEPRALAQEAIQALGVGELTLSRLLELRGKQIDAVRAGSVSVLDANLGTARDAIANLILNGKDPAALEQMAGTLAQMNNSPNSAAVLRDRATQIRYAMGQLQKLAASPVAPTASAFVAQRSPSPTPPSASPAGAPSSPRAPSSPSSPAGGPLVVTTPSASVEAEIARIIKESPDVAQTLAQAADAVQAAAAKTSPADPVLNLPGSVPADPRPPVPPVPLIIPNQATMSTTATDPATIAPGQLVGHLYRVKKGDSPYALAKRYSPTKDGNQYKALLPLNPKIAKRIASGLIYENKDVLVFPPTWKA